MKKNYLRSLFTLVIGLPCVLFADTTDKNQPYHFKANQTFYNSKEHLITLIGKVEVSQGTTQLFADKLVITTTPDNKTVKHFIAYGNPARYDSISNEKTGDHLFAHALIINYDYAHDTVLLLHKAEIKQQQNVFQGSHILYNLKSRNVVSTPTAEQPQTTIILQPQTLNNTSKKMPSAPPPLPPKPASTQTEALRPHSL